ncbi:MAG: S41 family peptidase [Thiolinea sp.]
MPELDIIHDILNNSALAADMPLLRNELPADAGLTVADKRTLVDQARVLIEQVYAHLHLKTALYGIDPVQRLTLLQYRLEDPEDDVVKKELEFHRELIGIFHSMHDLHTNYVLPVPYRRMTAVLPFLVEEFFDDNEQPHYIVTKMITSFKHESFKPGVEILIWNGLPIKEAIRRNGENESGSNAAARFAVGLRSLTIRPLSISLPPEEIHILIHYRDAENQEHTIEFEWLTLKAGATSTADIGLSIDRSSAIRDILDMDQGMDDLYQESMMGYHLQAEQINLCRAQLYASTANAEVPGQPSLTDALESKIPDVIRAATLKTPSGEFAYLRLYSFMVDDHQSFLAEIIRLLQKLPQNGLVLDLRGNPGGLITAAETLLQLLTPKTIEPEKAQFKSDPLVRELCRRNAPSPIVPMINLGPWVDSLSRAHASGAIYSTGHSITSEHDANAIGQVYTAPVVLITDAYCYSAADMFAAGFRDHKIGQILGASDNTGAGGANVWKHMLLRVLADVPGIDESGILKKVFRELPRFADFRVSSRRMLRVGDEAGMPLEDFGVEPDQRHYMTRNDILNGNEDLYNHAAKILAAQPRYKLEVTVDAARCRLKLKTLKVDRVDWFIDDRASGSKDIKHNKATIKLPKSAEKRRVRLEAYEQGRKVAVSKQYIVCEE